jgi:tRNA G37 N-methylase Trm5
VLLVNSSSIKYLKEAINKNGVENCWCTTAIPTTASYSKQATTEA